MRILLLSLLLSTAVEAGIPVLALTEKDELITGEISENEYAQGLRTLKEAMDEKVVAGITALESGATGWKLSKFSLGLGLTGEIGIGPYKFATTLKQRFIYSR